MAAGAGVPPLDPRLVRHARAVRGFLAASVVAGLVVVAATIVQAVALARIVAATMLDGAGLGDQRGVFAALAAGSAGRALAAAAERRLAQRAAADAKRELRTAVLDRLAADPGHLGDEEAGALAGLLGRGIDGLDAYIGRYLPRLVVAVIAPPVVLVWIARDDLIAAAIVVATLPLVPLFMALAGWLAERRAASQWEATTRLSAHLLDVLAGLPTLRLFGRAEDQRAQVRAASEALRHRTMGTLRLAFVSALVLEFLATLSTALVAVTVGLRLLHGDLGFEAALTVLILTPEAYLPLRQVGAQFHASVEGLAAAGRLLELLDTPPAVTGAGRLGALEPVVLDGITVAYPGRPVPALDGLALVIEPGRTLAVTGPSGSGKTTLVRVLLALERPSAGRVLVGGVDLAGVDPRSWWAHVAWVPQHPWLLAGTVRDNLRLGRPGATDDELREALAASGVLGLLAELPHGLDTEVAEGGRSLSAGQRRRLAIARAVLRGAPFVVLDEPTAHLDPWNADAVARAIDALHGRTVVIVTHDAHLAARADHVLALPERRIDVDSTLTVTDVIGPVGESGGSGAGPGAPAVGSAPAVDRGAGDVAPVTGEKTDDAATVTGATAGDVAPVTGETAGDPLLAAVRPERRRLALATLAGTATVLAGAGLLVTSGVLISRAAFHPHIVELGVAIVGVRFFGVARAVLRYLERLASHDVALRVASRLRVRTFDALTRLLPGGLPLHTGDLLARLSSDVDTVQEVVVRGVAPPRVAAASAAVASAVVALLDPLAGLLLALVLVASLTLAPALARAAARRAVAATASRRAAYTVAVVDTVRGAADLAVAGALDRHLAHTQGTAADLATAERRTGTGLALAELVSGLLAAVALVGPLAAGVAAVDAGRLAGTTLAAIPFLALALAEPVAAVGEAAVAHDARRAAAARLARVLDAPVVVAEPEHPLGAPAGRRLELRDVHVRYVGAPDDTVRGVALVLEPGRRVVLTGPSGAGKSTIAHTLVRFLPVRAGTFLLDGAPVEAYRSDDVRAVVGLVEQEPHLFSGTLAANLRLARPGATDPEVAAAARRARLTLPLDTAVGPGGRRLSGGERQRVGLARVLLAGQPIVVLDEPTAHLDDDLAEALVADLLAATADRATLLITHRREGTDRADEVLVLADGRVSERVAGRGLERRVAAGTA